MNNTAVRNWSGANPMKHFLVGFYSYFMSKSNPVNFTHSFLLNTFAKNSVKNYQSVFFTILNSPVSLTFKSFMGLVPGQITLSQLLDQYLVTPFSPRPSCCSLGVRDQILCFTDFQILDMPSGSLLLVKEKFLG